METRLSGQDIAFEADSDDEEERPMRRCITSPRTATPSRWRSSSARNPRRRGERPRAGARDARRPQPPHHRDALAAREESLTLHDLAAEFKVSAERIRQIEVKALEKMKKAMQGLPATPRCRTGRPAFSEQFLRVVRRIGADAVVPHEQAQPALGIDDVALRAVVDGVGIALLALLEVDLELLGDLAGCFEVAAQPDEARVEGGDVLCERIERIALGIDAHHEHLDRAASGPSPSPPARCRRAWSGRRPGSA